jgi:hypothetical protein
LGTIGFLQAPSILFAPSLLEKMAKRLKTLDSDALKTFAPMGFRANQAIIQQKN